jgi:hypothetical protein
MAACNRPAVHKPRRSIISYGSVEAQSQISCVHPTLPHCAARVGRNDSRTLTIAETMATLAKNLTCSFCNQLA